MSDAATIGAEPARVAWIRDPRIRSLIFQGIALVVVIAIGWYLVDNTIDNLRKRDIASGFGFLNDTAGFDIIQTLVPYKPSRPTAGRSSSGCSTPSWSRASASSSPPCSASSSASRGCRQLADRQARDGLCRDLPQHAAAAADLLLVLRRAQAAAQPRGSLSFLGVVFLNNRGLYLPSPATNARILHLPAADGARHRGDDLALQAGRTSGRSRPASVSPCCGRAWA